ncbi:MAG TPA: prepilin-type N-terminal cleavage/methylation domain-containing protein [Candidatus Baltobacteraceae bacterium]|nr:prepilin-type N-terminal cleavage/methylation domain-containing protein [Candidatus Baltobacteraceae bacterium]
MGRSNARGFSLLELLVALAIVTVIVWLLFHALTQTLLAGRMQARDDLEQSTIGQLVDTLTTEQDDAWAMYVPPADVLGKSNGDGHEVDFFTRDGKQRPYFWAYGYDKTAQTLTRYRFSAPGGIATQDATYTGITKFYARTYPVTALLDASTPIYSALYSGAALQSGIVHFYPSMPWIAGGNNITYVHVEGASVKQDLQLTTNTAPSGFTVVVYYTPSPSPTPLALKSWPANLVVGTSGWGFGTTTNGAPCYAYAYGSGTYPGGSADTTLGSTPAMSIGGIAGGASAEIGVASDGCEIFSTDGVNWTPVGTPGSAIPQAVMISYEPSGTPETFSIQSNTCGNLNIGNWYPNSATGVQAALEATGAAAGTCSITFTDGQSTQTPAPDAGLVNVNVLTGCGAIGGSCTFTPNWPPAGGQCDPLTGGNAGYTGLNQAATMKPTGLGTLSANADGSYTFTRTASGTVTIDESEQYQGIGPSRLPGFNYSCTTTNKIFATLTFN